MSQPYKRPRYTRPSYLGAKGFGSNVSASQYRKRASVYMRGTRIARNPVVKNSCDFGRGFPLKVKQTMKYVEQVGVVCTAGAANSYIFSCNGLYDPNITSTGHQPLYFDQMAALYDHYCVLGSKITVRCAPISSTNTPVIMNIYIDDNASGVASSPLSQAEQTLSQRPRYVWNGDIANIVMNSNWSAKKFFGGNVLANTDLQGTSASNPTEQSYWIITAQPSNFSDTLTIQLLVEIEYIVVWKELRDVAQS